MAKKKSYTVKTKSRLPLVISDKKIFLILLTVFIVINILNFDPKLFLGGDNAHYLTLAKSILSGQGYRDIFAPDSPPHTQYPPGFPLLLIPGLILFGNNFVFIKLIILLLSISAFYLFYKFYKNYLAKEVRILALALFALCPLIVMYSHYILSEIPYLFFSILAIYLIEKLQVQNRKKILLFIVMILSLIFTYYIRTIGISLIFAALIYLIYKKRYKEFLILLAFAFIFVLLWQSRLTKISGSGYFVQFFSRNPYDLAAGNISFSELIIRFLNNMRLYTLEVFPKILLPSLQNPIWLKVFGFIASGLVGIGWVSRLKKITVLEIYMVFFLAITFAWPEVWTGDRFLLPVVPFLFYYFIKGILMLSKKSFAIPMIIIGFCLLFSITEHIKTITVNLRDFSAYTQGDRMAGYSTDWRNYFTTIEWIKNNTSPDEIVISRKPQFTYLFSNRKSFVYPFSTDENIFFEVLKKYRPQYILFDQFYWTGTTTKYLGPIVNKYHDKFQIIYKTNRPEMYVLKVDSSLFTN